MLRRWYLDAAPSSDARQAAINRLTERWGASTRELPAHRAPRAWRRWVPAALAASAVAAMALTWSVQHRSAADRMGEARDATLVAFEVRLPSRIVHDVSLAGDFNGWDLRATPMHREGSSDIWKTSVSLPPGRHVYSFVVDGKEWVIDPLAPRAELDELGPANVIAISGASD